MARPQTEEPLAEWRHIVPNLSLPSGEFYLRVEQAIARQQLPNCRIRRMHFREGGFTSSRRIYLRIERQKLVFDICAAPFGTNYFFSSWLHFKQSALLRMIAPIPYVNVLVGMILLPLRRPLTYHQIDTAHAFHTSVHETVLEIVDELSAAQGLRRLREDERKPVLENFYGGRK